MQAGMDVPDKLMDMSDIRVIVFVGAHDDD
jgi:hypothetical protein